MNIDGRDGGSSSHHGGSSTHHGGYSSHHSGFLTHHGGPSRDNLPQLSPEDLWFHKGVVVRLVTESIQSNYDFPYLNWSEMTFPVHDKWFCTFKTYFRWKLEIERDVCNGYYHKVAERLKDLVHKAALKGRDSRNDPRGIEKTRSRDRKRPVAQCTLVITKVWFLLQRLLSAWNTTIS